MASILTAAVCVAVGCSTALAQFVGGVNVDFNAVSGAGSGQPSIVFGGAAAQGGYWNPLNPPYTNGTSVAVRNLGNSANAVTCFFTTAGGGTGAFGFNNANTTGDAELLMDDVHDIGATGSTVSYSFGSFAPGVYDVFTYAAAPDNATFRTRVTVRTNSSTLPGQVVGGTIPAGGVFTEGVTHARHTVALSVPGPLIIDVTPEVSFGSVNGVQIVRRAPTRLYVNSAGGVGSGLSWGSALATLQRALAIARATPSVTEIWVARGVQRPDGFPSTAGNREAVFDVPGGVTVYGGFLGTEATLAERPDPLLPANLTILSGDIGTAAATDNTLRLVLCGLTATSTVGTVTLDGLVMERAYSDEDAGDPYTAGCAVAAVDSSVVMRRCVVRDCFGGDAAVHVAEGRSGTLSDCLLERNSSTRTTACVSLGVLTMDRCIVRDHRMPGTFYGSLISLRSGTATLTNCLVHDNNRNSGAGTGMFMLVVGTPFNTATATVRNCTLAGNTGGGIHIGSSGTLPSSLVLRNSVLWGNRRPIDPSATVEEQQIRTYGTPVINILDTIVEGWTGVFGNTSTACFSGDPWFVDADGADNIPGNADDNYRLAPFSPARDSGWNTGTPTDVTTDLDGLPRRVDDPAVANGGFNLGYIDRGCYEAQAPSAPCPGDIGRTGGVPGSDATRDNNDFVVFIDWFFMSDSRADCGRTGGVAGPDGLFNNNDFVVYIDQFFAPCP
ncbi:MAG: GC-type dockerin domain-anchored protein [Phycisphaerales bacterium]|nr:GC-type dockerin domain-anchored protein [Phycisphaerales bacterium]